IPNNFSNLLQTMQTAEFAIGMRYHFLIAAMLTKTPVLPISYSPKVDELFNGTPLEKYLLPVSKLSVDSLTNYLKRLSVDYNNVKVYLKARKNNLQELAQNHIDSFNDYLKTFDQK
ncbi:polysaccharide pyruvyl transferase family protein, partial [Patescibacteria group bacterium]|nr:polysaccharide pyruvyl transferase family protein [Patescibacteria group bacterium]